MSNTNTDLPVGTTLTYVVRSGIPTHEGIRSTSRGFHGTVIGHRPLVAHPNVAGQPIVDTWQGRQTIPRGADVSVIAYPEQDTA